MKKTFRSSCYSQLHRFIHIFFFLMELPTRTLPHNYIAIIKIFAMSLCTVSFTAFFFFLLRQASNAHVTPEETLQRHCEGWAAKQRRESWTVPRSRGWRRHPLLMPLGDLHHPVALQFWGGEGRARPARGGGGPLVTRYFLVKRGGGRNGFEII